MAFLDDILNIGTHFFPRDLPLFITTGGLELNPEQITNGELQPVSDIHLPDQSEMFMSAVERQRREDMLFLLTGACTPRVVFTFLTPLQKTAYAYWRDTTDLEFPGAKPIEIEILRELRRLNAGR